MRGLIVSGLLAAGLSLAGGCILFTGGTDGYSSVDSGSTGTACTSAASCGDAGHVCCLVVNASTTSTNGTCEPTCSIPSSYPQLCATNAECGDAGPCTMQSCTIDGGGGISFTLQACGTVPGCKGP
jgi:hypothetical protein